MNDIACEYISVKKKKGEREGTLLLWGKAFQQTQTQGTRPAQMQGTEGG